MRYILLLIGLCSLLTITSAQTKYYNLDFTAGLTSTEIPLESNYQLFLTAGAVADTVYLQVYVPYDSTGGTVSTKYTDCPYVDQSTNQLIGTGQIILDPYETVIIKPYLTAGGSYRFRSLYTVDNKKHYAGVKR